MTFGLVQILLGVMLMAAGPVLGGPTWALAWPGISVFVVGLGYLGIGPRVFGKDARDGRLSPWIRVAIFPYFAVAWGLWQLKSRLFGENPHDEVAPGIHVGRRPLGAHEVPPATRVVVDLTSEFPRAAVYAHIERYLCLPTLDTAAPAERALGALLDDLAEHEGPIFVHCAMGHGRSATFAAALMIRRGLATDVDDAIRKMCAKRPAVHLHPPQRAVVERLVLASVTLTSDDPPEDRPDRAPDPA